MLDNGASFWDFGCVLTVMTGWAQEVHLGAHKATDVIVTCSLMLFLVVANERVNAAGSASADFLT